MLCILRSYVRDSEKFYKGIGDADKNTKAQLARSDYMQHYGIDKNARFVFGDIMEAKLKKRRKCRGTDRRRTETGCSNSL